MCTQISGAAGHSKTTGSQSLEVYLLVSYIDVVCGVYAIRDGIHMSDWLSLQSCSNAYDDVDGLKQVVAQTRSCLPRLTARGSATYLASHGVLCLLGTPQAAALRA